MNLDQIKELLDLISDTDVTELEVQDGDEKIKIRRKSGDDNDAPYVVVAPSVAGAPVAAPAPLPAASAGPAVEASEEPSDDDLVLVTAPMVGTFYESPSPGSPAFVDVGDTVSKGKTLCIIEAMKLMNEIEAEADGVIAKRFVSDGEPIEFGQALFGIRPS